MPEKKLIPFVPKGPKDNKDGTILDHGTLGKYNYEVYQRGNIHVFSPDKTLMFRKDCTVFEDELNKLDLKNLKADGALVIKGCGETDNLVIARDADGEYEIRLDKRTGSVIDLLKGLLKKGRK